MALTLTDIQKVTVSITPVDAVGNVAPVENVVWTSSDESILTVTASEDGLSAVVETVGHLGSAQIMVEADALIGEGYEPLAGILDVTVVGSKAVGFTINAGTPEPREIPSGN